MMHRADSTLAFTSTVFGNALTHAAARRATCGNTSGCRPAPHWKMSRNAENKGFFGKLKDAILLPLVTVPGGGDGKELLECVFCKGSGFCECDACRGSGEDALGTCFMCDGNTYIKCTVCQGVGTVDRIRRGGTDDQNEFVVKRRKS